MPGSPNEHPPSRPAPRLRRRAAIALLIALPLALLALGLTATCRPRWYRPVSTDYARLHDDKRDLAALGVDIGAALNAGRPIQLQLREDQLNRWIAARAEMWPEAAVDIRPLRDPQLTFHDDEIRFAALAEHAGWRAVLSITCRVAVTGDRVLIRCNAARLGLLPLPAGWLASLVTTALRGTGVSVEAGPDGALALHNDWLWPNGKRRFRLADLRISAAVVHFGLEPTGLPQIPAPPPQP